MAKGRPPKSPESLSGTNLEQWVNDPSNIRWAASDTMFHKALTVLINERWRSRALEAPQTENYMAGQVAGYEKAIEVLQTLGTGIRNRQPTEPEATYEGDQL